MDTISKCETPNGEVSLVECDGKWMVIGDDSSIGEVTYSHDNLCDAVECYTVAISKCIIPSGDSMIF